MRRPDFRFRVRHLMIGVAVAAVGLLLLRATWGGANEIILRRYPDHRRPWNGDDAIRVRLDLDRLRAYGLTKEDVREALTPSHVVDPKEPTPPAGVVFVTRVWQPDRYGRIIMKAKPDGELVRLKDVASVEVFR